MQQENKQYDKFLVALWDHEDPYMSAVKSIRAKGVEPTESLTPFPVHGLEHVLDLPYSRLHRAGFAFGALGMCFALALMTYFNVFNYPINVGGKPYFALPSFIPITFELTVLFAGVGMVIVYCIRNGLFPGNVPRIYDERITDDRFALVFGIDDKSEEEVEALSSLVKEHGALETKIKDFVEDGELFAE